LLVDVLEKHSAPGREQDIITTAKESMNSHGAYLRGHGASDAKSVVMASQLQTITHARS
jgi:hypothetical protein